MTWPSVAIRRNPLNTILLLQEPAEALASNGVVLVIWNFDAACQLDGVGVTFVVQEGAEALVLYWLMPSSVRTLAEPFVRSIESCTVEVWFVFDAALRAEK